MRFTPGEAPLVSTHWIEAVRIASPDVQVTAMFCGVVVVPMKLRLTAPAPEKLAAFAPVSVQPLTVVVAPAHRNGDVLRRAHP